MTTSSGSLESAPDPWRAPRAAPRRLSVSGREAVRAVTLANGMRVIVWPVRNIPNVALYNWVRVGSRNEVPGATGLAHFFEHMMFNGTSRHPPGEFDRLMEAQGGANNAFTSDDVTVYQDWFPASALELVFDLESDRMAHLAFTPEVIESERGVVYSERRLRVEDNNTACSPSRCRRRRSSRTRIVFRPSAGRRTSSPGGCRTCRLFTAPTTRPTI